MTKAQQMWVLIKAMVRDQRAGIKKRSSWKVTAKAMKNTSQLADYGRSFQSFALLIKDQTQPSVIRE